jgi:hypothetical protein
MRQLDLQPALRRRRPLAEYLEDQPGPVDHLRLGAVFQILLLDRRDRSIDDEQLGLVPLDRLGDQVRLPRSEQGRRLRPADSEVEPLGDVDPDRFGEAGRLVEPRLDVAPARFSRQVGKGEDGSGPSAELVVALALGGAQLGGSSSSASAKLSGCSG